MLLFTADAHNMHVQALTGPPSQDAIEDTTGYSYDYLLSMPIHSLTVEKVCYFSAACISS